MIYSFNVDIDGSMKDFRLVRGLDPLMDAEALRVLQLVNEKMEYGGIISIQRNGIGSFM